MGNVLKRNITVMNVKHNEKVVRIKNTCGTDKIL